MSLESNQIPEFLKDLQETARAIETELVDITFFMRGGITLNEAFHLTPNQREAVGDRIKKNMELTEKHGMPLY